MSRFALVELIRYKENTLKFRYFQFKLLKGVNSSSTDPSNNTGCVKINFLTIL